MDALKTEEKNNRRLPWGDKLRDLLSTSAFISPGNTKDTINAVFWPTLIALHEGLREEETLQLRVADFDKIDDIAVIRIQSGEGQHLKSGAARRIIPIHSNLIRLGLLHYVAECRAAGEEWLFPDIERCAAKDRLSGTFTKKFTYYRVTEGVYDPRRDFHSLRTNFNVILKRNKCPLDVRKRLIGHELTDVTEVHYDPEGAPIAEFRDWIEKIQIDISGIRSPWAEAPVSTGNVVRFGSRT